MPTFILSTPSSDDAFIKVVVGIIIMVFWLGGALMSALKKRADDAKRRARYNQTPAGFKRPARAPATAPAGVPTAQRAKSRANQRAPKRQAYVPLATAAPSVSRITAAPTAPAPSRPARTAAVAPPSQIAHLLRRPESLRAALILNEVLSPPVSLRGEADSGVLRKPVGSLQ